MVPVYYCWRKLNITWTQLNIKKKYIKMNKTVLLMHHQLADLTTSPTSEMTVTEMTCQFFNNERFLLLFHFLQIIHRSHKSFYPQRHISRNICSLSPVNNLLPGRTHFWMGPNHPTVNTVVRRKDHRFIPRIL